MVSATDLETIEEESAAIQKDIVDFLSEMINADSINPPGEYDAIRSVVTSKFEEFGWDVETVWAPDDLLENVGIDPEYPRPNVLAYASRGDGPVLALNAHLDTVPADPSGWTYDPFDATLADGRIWGRGAKDSKGRIAAYTAAVGILQRANLMPTDGTIVLAMTADEETGGEAGAGYLIQSGQLAPDYAIVEGSFDKIDYAAAGVVHLSVTVTGKASHAGVDPEKGVNAIVGAACIITRLEEYLATIESRVSEVPRIGRPTCTTATITGGKKTNVVPAECTFTVDRRVLPEETVDDVMSEIRKTINEVTLPEGATVQIEELLRAEPYVTEPDGPLLNALTKNIEAVTGTEIEVGGTRGFTDARFFAHGGAETLKYGPGDQESNVHGADENLKLAQLRETGAAIAASIVDLYRSVDG